MKKKLIAIVASLAMVATMVPASAFAATASTKAVEVDANLRLATQKQLQAEMDALGSGTSDLKTMLTDYRTKDAAGNNADLKGSTANGNLTLTGTLPYVGDYTSFSSLQELQKGHYTAIALNVSDPQETDVTGWAYLCTTQQKDSAGKAYTAYSFQKFNNFTKPYETFIVRLDGNNPSYTVYYLTGTGVADLTSGVYKTANQEGHTDANDINTLRSNLAKEANTVASKEVSVNTAGLTLLTQAQTEAAANNKVAVTGFVNAVAAIYPEADSEAADKLANIDDSNPVTTAYRQQTTAARAIYNALTADQKKIVDDAVAGSDDADINKIAYKKLEQAETNIKAMDTLNDVAALVKALPDYKTLNVNDAAAVKQVNDAQKAVSELPKGARDALLAPPAYLTNDQVTNYTEAVRLVNNTAAQAVMDAIRTLPTLPESFADKASVDTVNTPLVAAEKAYKNLTEDAQKAVNNYSVLTKYRTDYDALLKKHIDPLYEKAAKINLEEALTDEDKALIAELKAYVEDKYMKEPTNIKDFDQDVYDELVAALNKEEKDGSSLENATIAAIADQSYTGKAIEPAVAVTDKAGKEIAAEEYTVIYSNNKDAGTATVTVAAKSSSAYTGSVSATFTITPAALTADMVKVANATYTGKAVKPAVSVASGVDYTVAYKNNTAVGKASAVVTGTGNYTGTITKNFIVKPAKESITSLKAGKKQITVAYKAQTGAKYRVICKASGLKAIGTNTTATKKTVKKLKSGKTYQVKVRAYKAVDGKTYYGTYSAVKKVKVK